MENKTELQSKFIEMRGKGNSFDKIAKELKVSKPTLIKWSKEFRQEVSNYVAIERDTLFEQYKITKYYQMKLYGERLKGIREELSKRSLEDITTEKLMNMELRILSELKDLDQNIILSGTENGCQFSLEREVQWAA